ncbi:C2 domain containing protein [Trema orientale]|uniref:C2 domain containing protein n=1 Tax=Trema orientale TaxID=63057 RepID=A0A2P5EKR4_TREOI|nr:C2 domain containing protein [Trema orientale]
MGNPQIFSSLSLELKIIEAKNVESKTRGDLFVRCYLPSGGSKKRRIGVDTKEVPSKNDHVWNQSFSLECSGIGHEGSMDLTKLSQESLVFELRWRNRVPVLGTSGFGGSKLLGRAEIAWEEVIESPNMVLDKWVYLVNSTGGDRPAKLKKDFEMHASKTIGY